MTATQDESTEGEPTLREAAQPPAVFVTVVAPKRTAEEIGQERQDRETEQRLSAQQTALSSALTRYTRGLFIATIALAAITAVLAFFAYKQAGDMSTSLTIAKTSADAAQKSAATAERALVMTQRAYVAAESWILEGFSPGVVPTAHFKLRNTGATRATLLQRTYSSIVADALPSIPPDGNTFNEAKFPLEPEQRMGKHVRLKALSPAEHAAIVKGSTKLWVWGYVDYEDGFGTEQRTRFCVFYSVTLSSLVQCAVDGYHTST